MKINLLYTLFFACCSISCFSQTDSLSIEVKMQQMSYQALSDSSIALALSGAHQESIPYAQEMERRAKKLFGVDSIDYYQALINLGIAYQDASDYTEALPCLENAVSLMEKNGDTHFPQFANLLTTLARLHRIMGKHDLVLPLLMRALDQVENVIGKDDPQYITTLNTLAIHYVQAGEFEKAIPLYTTALEYGEKILGTENRDYGTINFNIGSFYMRIGQYEKALPLVQKASKIMAKAYGETHPHYGLSLNHLSNIYIYLNQLEKAFYFSKKASEIVKKSLGEHHYYYLVTLNTQCVFYEKTGDYENALLVGNQCLNGLEKTLGKDSPKYFFQLNLVGNIYEKMNLIDTAIALNQQALEISERIVGKDNQITGDILDDLANCYDKTGQHDKAIVAYQQLFSNRSVRYRKFYTSFGENERLKFLTLLDSNLEQMYSYAYRNQNMVATSVQNMNLLVKGLALEGNAKVRTAILAQKDSALTHQYNIWKAIRLNIANAYALAISERIAEGIDLKALEKEAEQLESELSRASTAMAAQLTGHKTEQIIFKDLKNKLHLKESAVDFIHFSYTDGKLTTDSIFYAALITCPEYKKPHFIFLSEEKELRKLLKATVQKDGSNYIENPRISYDLYKAIWEPLEPYLEGVDKIHLSPSGILHRVAFGALQSDITKDTRLMDQFEIAYYGNLRDFVLKEKTQENKQEIVLLGGAQYNLDSLTLATFSKEQIPAQEMTKNDDEYIVAAVTGIGRSIADDSTRTAVRFNYLPGTLEEVESISKLFQNKKWNTNTLLKKEALEDNIKSLSGTNAPGILHIATHGYFFSPYDKDEYTSDNTLRDRIKYADNPLLRSGLVFTGVNHAWEGGQPVRGMDDGVLTAYEISNMDLLTTDLVVLSACETGLGDVHNGEGVFGLQRAFKTAGVDNMIISLWKVPDTETSELMALFYENYLNGKSIRSSLRDAQREMAKKYSAYFWAAFILVE